MAIARKALLKSYSDEELNRLSAAGHRELLKEVIPKFQKRIDQIQQRFDTTFALRRFIDNNVDLLQQNPYSGKWQVELPSATKINSYSIYQLKALTADLKEFESRKTSTIEGQRKALNQSLSTAGFNEDEIIEFRKQIGGYKGLNDLFNMIEDIRATDKFWEKQMGSDGTYLSALLMAWKELPPKDRHNANVIAKRAREIYDERTKEEAKKSDFPANWRNR